MLNRVSIVGNLGADPEIRTTQAGTRIANFRVAATERWRDKAGAQKERTEWIPCVIINQMLIGVVEARLSKGSKVFVEGSFQTRKYTDSSGIERSITEVLVGNFGSRLEVFNGDQIVSAAADATQRRRPPHQQAERRHGQDESDPNGYDDDLPF